MGYTEWHLKTVYGIHDFKGAVQAEVEAWKKKRGEKTRGLDGETAGFDDDNAAATSVPYFPHTKPTSTAVISLNPIRVAPGTPLTGHHRLPDHFTTVPILPQQLGDVTEDSPRPRRSRSRAGARPVGTAAQGGGLADGKDSTQASGKGSVSAGNSSWFWGKGGAFGGDANEDDQESDCSQHEAHTGAELNSPDSSKVGIFWRPCVWR